MPLAQIVVPPLITDQPTVVTVKTVAAPTFESNVIDTKCNPVTSLLNYAEGSPWIVNYYSQVVGKDTELKGQDDGQSGVYQQYRLIKNLVLRVTTPLQWSQEPERKLFKVTGSGIITAGVIPSDGDMFSADVGDGRMGIFQITLGEKKTILQSSVYLIDYYLVYYADEDPNRKTDLDSKVIQTLTYDANNLLNGGNGVITPQAAADSQSLAKLSYELINSFMRDFYSLEYKTLLVPGQIGSTYDHFVTDFFLKITDTRDNLNIKNIRRMNVDDDYALTEPQLYAAILQRDTNILSLSNVNMGLLSTRAFSANPLMRGIAYSGLQYIVYPVNPVANIDKNYNLLTFGKTPSFTSMDNTLTTSGYLPNVLPVNHLVGNQTVFDIQQAFKDPAYVFSNSFYTTGLNATGLESMTKQFLNNQTVDGSALFALAKNFNSWGALERFYYIPIILSLIKSVIGCTRCA